MYKFLFFPGLYYYVYSSEEKFHSRNLNAQKQLLEYISNKKEIPLSKVVEDLRFIYESKAITVIWKLKSIKHFQGTLEEMTVQLEQYLEQLNKNKGD